VRRIVHLSDLHFGWNESGLVETLCALVVKAKPDLTVISGDFVEHATLAEFKQARNFIAGIPKPILMVPGNHDLPFSNLPLRFIQRLNLYKKYITGDLAPFFQDDEIAVMGVDTARIWPIRGGRISALQVRDVKGRPCHLPSHLTRVLVTHHPFDLPPEFASRNLVKRGEAALEHLACCLDLLVAGRMHVGASGRVADRFKTANGALVFSQAGTAISKRYKGETNSFNVIEVDSPHLRVQKYRWDSDESAYEAKCGLGAEEDYPQCVGRRWQYVIESVPMPQVPERYLASTGILGRLFRRPPQADAASPGRIRPGDGSAIIKNPAGIKR
jgi:3',5'-cyclic AMP phosphodiesterase CpdA